MNTTVPLPATAEKHLRDTIRWWLHAENWVLTAQMRRDFHACHSISFGGAPHIPVKLERQILDGRRRYRAVSSESNRPWRLASAGAALYSDLAELCEDHFSVLGGWKQAA